MPETRVHRKCPNCGALLPWKQTLPGRRKCDYCGVAVSEKAPDIPPSAPPPPSSASDSGGSSVRTALTLSLSIMGLAAGLFFYMRGVDRGVDPAGAIGQALSPVVAPVPAPVPVVPAAPDPIPPIPSPPGKHTSRGGTKGPHNEPCHISSHEMSELRDSHQSAVIRCFATDNQRLPKNVGLTSNWSLVIDGSGKVVRVRPHLHVLDYNRSEAERAATPYAPPAPGSEAVRCAVREIEGWSFAPYLKDPLPNVEMTCDLNLSIVEP